MSYLRFASQHKQSDISAEEVDNIRVCLSELLNSISKLDISGLFPYNPRPLLARLKSLLNIDI